MTMKKCPGVLIVWTAGSVWDSYPFHRHGSDGFPWEVIGFHEDANELQLKSLSCRQKISESDHTCLECLKLPLSAPFRKFVDMNSQEARVLHTSYEYLNHRQLIAVLRNMVTQKEQLRMKVSNYILYTVAC